MIRELTVENVGIIERASLELSSGLTALTGETGAGKSLLIDSVALALGSRADSTIVRTGATKSTVSLRMFSPKHIESEYGTADILVQREILSEGRSVCKINNDPVPVSALRKFGESLVDLHGQHEHQSLLKAEQHLSFLDAWIGEPASKCLAALHTAMLKYAEVKREHRDLTEGARTREHELDLLKFQVTEIREADLQIGERISLEQLITRLQNVETISLSVSRALEAIAGNDGGRDKIASAVRELQAAAILDSAFSKELTTIQEALFTIEESCAALSRLLSEMESQPTRLESAIERLETIKKLLRKYGDDEQLVLEFLDQAEMKLGNLENSGERVAELEQQMKAAWSEVVACAAKLTELRMSAGPQFAQQVRSEMRELAMEKSEFLCCFEERDIDSSGNESMEFLFSANEGESMKPLSRIASGGEISRVMLALKVVLAGRAGAPTLIFDEVDIGLSGRAAAVVAKKLRKLSAQYQVIVISHLPQIAAAADQHFQIMKVEQNGRTMTTLRLLDDETRISEIARMLAGETVGESALANARELLATK